MRLSKFIKWGLKTLRPEWVRTAVQNNLYLVDYFRKTLHLDDPQVKESLAPLLRLFWDEIEDYLTKVKNVYDVLCEREDIKVIIDTPQGRRWLNENVKRLYRYLFWYAWEK